MEGVLEGGGDSCVGVTVGPANESQTLGRLFVVIDVERERDSGVGRVWFGGWVAPTSE